MRTYTCLQLTHGNCRLMELAARSGHFKLVREYSLPMPELKQNPVSHPQLVGMIGKLLQGQKPHKLYVSLSSDFVLLKSIQLPEPIPDVAADLQRRAIETTLEAENHIPVPLDAAAYDYHLSSSSALLVGWMRQDGLASVVDALRGAGVELVYLTPQPVLLANRLIAEYGGAERVCGVHVDGDRCDLAVVEGAEVYGGRSFEIEDPAHLWESVRQTVDNCPNPNGMPMTRLVLFQAYSQNRERASPLSVPTGVFDCEVTAATFDWAEVLIAPIENSDGIGLNLLKPLLLKQRRHRKQLTKRWLWRGLPIAVGLLLLLANLYLFNAVEGKQYRIDQLRDVQVKAKQLQTKTELLTTEHRAIEKALTQLAWGERRYPPLAKRLVQIAECIPATVQLTEIHTLPPPRKPSSSFDIRQTLRLIGLAKVQSEIDAFRIALLTQIEFSVVKQVKTEPTLIKGKRGLEFTLLLISVKG